MTLRLVLRTIAARPVRAAVLAGGFGFGIAVMAALLGVGEVIVDQSRAPALRGGGDLVVTGRAGDVHGARFLIASVLGAPPLLGRAAGVSPTRARDAVPRPGRAGHPRCGRAAAFPAWSARWATRRRRGSRRGPTPPSDRAWTDPRPEDVLRAMDRFHAIPDVPAARGLLGGMALLQRPLTRRAAPLLPDVHGRAARGRGPAHRRRPPPARTGRTDGGVLGARGRRGGRAARAGAGPGDRGQPRAARRAALPDPPRPRIRARRSAAGGRHHARRGRRPFGAALRGARARAAGSRATWCRCSPARSTGSSSSGSRRVPLGGAVGYHDHNWGFWQGVSWQWGQVSHEGLSFLYGRIVPPRRRRAGGRGAAARHRRRGRPVGADRLRAQRADRGDLGGAGRRAGDGPHRRPRERPRPADGGARGGRRAQRASAAGPALGSAGARDFLQLRASYRVRGRIGDQAVDFTALGSAETFRGSR